MCDVRAFSFRKPNKTLPSRGPVGAVDNRILAELAIRCAVVQGLWGTTARTFFVRGACAWLSTARRRPQATRSARRARGLSRRLRGLHGVRAGDRGEPAGRQWLAR